LFWSYKNKSLNIITKTIAAVKPKSSKYTGNVLLLLFMAQDLHSGPDAGYASTLSL
jgi:hypothetical protein